MHSSAPHSRGAGRRGRELRVTARPAGTQLTPGKAPGAREAVGASASHNPALVTRHGLRAASPGPATGPSSLENLYRGKETQFCREPSGRASSPSECHDGDADLPPHVTTSSLYTSCHLQVCERPLRYACDLAGLNSLICRMGRNALAQMLCLSRRSCCGKATPSDTRARQRPGTRGREGRAAL